MYKMRAVVYWFVKILSHWILRGKHVIVFSGARRSGNHACIDWIANAVTGERTKLLDRGNCYVTENGAIIHLNELNFGDKLGYISLLRKTRRCIRKASVVFLSLEDYVPGKVDFYTPKNATRIHITRSVLSTIASRLTYNIKKAYDGIDRGDLDIDEPLFLIMRNLQKRTTENTHIWSYDRWLSDKSWRRSFLEELNYTADLIPPINSFGGGSSFLGKDSAAMRTMSDKDRWESVAWPKRVIGLVKNNTDLLRDDEREFIAREEERIRKSENL